MKSPMFTGIEKFFFNQCTSTNMITKELLKQGLIKEGAVVYTDYQLSGKGQENTVWYSEKGKNIMMSILYKPVFLPINKFYFLNMVVSLGICEALIKKSGIKQLMIKWPNDIIVPEKGKIAGILIENTISNNKILNAIIGIGINVNQVKFKKDAGNPVSMKQLNAKIYGRIQLMDLIFKQIEKYYLMLRAEKYDQIYQSFTAFLYAYKNFREYKIPASGKKIIAQIIKIDTEGKLILEDKTGNKYSFRFKEIEF